MKRIILTFTALIISTLMFAQNNVAVKQNNAPSSSVKEKNADKKVRYVEKRTKNPQKNSGNTIPKKSAVRKTENQKSMSSK